MAKLPAMKANTVAQDLTISGKNTLTIKNVLVGDVWVCSGQSNMAQPLRRVIGRDVNNPKGLGQANYSQIRLYKMHRIGALEPQTECEGNWSVCTPEAAMEFSATGYFFGREIHLAERIPVGLIGANRGSTSAEYWTSLEALQSEAVLAKYVNSALAAKADYPERKERYVQDMLKWKQDNARWSETLKQWEADAAKASAEGKAPPSKPKQPGAVPVRPVGMDRWDDNFMAVPTVLFNGMMAPLMPFGIKGVIWYQGGRQCRRGGALSDALPDNDSGLAKPLGPGQLPLLLCAATQLHGAQGSAG